MARNIGNPIGGLVNTILPVVRMVAVRGVTVTECTGQD
jgi:hypothetical protein